LVEIFTALSALFKQVGKISNKTTKGLTTMFKSVSARVTETSGIDDLLDSVLGFLDFLKPVAKLLDIFAGTLKQVLAPVMKEFLTKIFSPEAIQKIQDFARQIGEALIPILETLFDIFLDVVDSGVMESMVALFLELLQLFASILDTIAPFIPVLLDIIVIITNAIASLIKYLSPAVIELVEGIVTIIWYIIKAIAWLIRAIWSIWKPEVAPWKEENFWDMPSLSEEAPKLQTGGMVARTGMAVVHTGEAVIPKEMVQMMENMGSNTINQNTKHQNVTLYATVLDDDMARKLARMIKDETFLVGG